MNEKEKRLRKAVDRLCVLLFLGFVLTQVCLGGVAAWLIIIAVEMADSALLITGIVCLCVYVIVMVIFGAEIVGEVKLSKEVKRREAEENKEKRNALLQTDEIIEQKEQAK